MIPQPMIQSARSGLWLGLLASLVWGSQVQAGQQPHWIWAKPAQSRAADSAESIRLSGLLTADRPIVSAKLKLAADFTACRVRINRTDLVRLDEFAPWYETDITQWLQPGANQIELECDPGAGPAAVAVSLAVKYSDGTSSELLSDTTWKANIRRQRRWRKAQIISLGQVAPEFWGAYGVARITAFDNYEQWRLASGADSGTSPASFVVQNGFEVELLRTAARNEGSWVSMAVDADGRIVIGREDRGLLRMTVAEDSSRISNVETINTTLQEPRGLLFAHGALYANANNSKAMYRLHDTNGDGEFDQVELLREFPGGVGHGRNDLALGPDGLIYSIHGDAVAVPKQDILDRTSPFRAANRGQNTTEGVLLRTDPRGQTWELLAAGLRNPFGIAFNTDGELFTYDADAEFDMGSPWYRPTRIDQLVSGADFGWRGRTRQWPPYFPDRGDNSPATADVGKGSPTAVKSGAASAFPPRYQQAVFALDWAYGRVLACHLIPKGAGYGCHVETFLKGQPLNVTDLDFSPEGQMYLITGGRKTRSALYRIRYTETPVTSPAPTVQQQARNQYSADARRQRKQLERLHAASSSETVEEIWNHLGNRDPVIRHAARIALEHQPVESWAHRALAETNSRIAVAALLALARSRSTELIEPLLRKLNQISVQQSNTAECLMLIRAYELVFATPDSLPENLRIASESRLRLWFNSENVPRRGPIGGGTVRWHLARLMHAAGMRLPIDAVLQSVSNSDDQAERLHGLFVLRQQRFGWSPDRRQRYFELLRDLERSAYSGEGMPGFLNQLRADAVSTLNADERQRLGELVMAEGAAKPLSLTINRPLRREWTVESLLSELEKLSGEEDIQRGERLFDEIRCQACHRMRGRGGVVGPDLTSVSARFGRRDLVSSIVTPSAVIPEKYRGVQVVTRDGRVLTGRVVTGGDYRSTVVRIVQDPLQPGEVTEVNKQDIEEHRPSPISTMPAGLLNTLTAREVRDLLAFLQSRGG